MMLDDQANHPLSTDGSSKVQDAFVQRNTVVTTSTKVRFSYQGETADLIAAGIERLQLEKSANIE